MDTELKFYALFGNRLRHKSPFITLNVVFCEHRIYMQVKSLCVTLSS
jgi:hypothetical protein